MKTISESELKNYYNMQDQLKAHIYSRSQKYFDMARADRLNIKTVDELRTYCSMLREKFLDSVGGIIRDGTPLDAKITATREYKDYKMENIIFKSRKDVYVTGSMYIPHGLNGKSAAVLFVHGHSGDTRHYPAYQIACDTLARAGLIVFAIDPVGQGERVSYFDEEKNDYIIQPTIFDHDAAGIPGTATDRFAASYFLSDEIRAIDYMVTRPEIDADRIGVTGNSGGGTQTSMLMAFDDRVAAAAPGTFISSRESYLYSGKPQDCEQIWYKGTTFGFEHISPIMMFAPKSLAILTVNYDFFTLEGTTDTVNEAKRYYEMFGKAENLNWFRDDSLHEYTPELSRQAARFFAKHLLGKDIEISDNNYEMKPYEDFFNTKSGRVRGEIDGAKFLFNEYEDRAELLRAERLKKKEEIRKKEAEEWLSERINEFREPYDFLIRKLEPIYDDGYAVQPCFWHSQRDIFNFASVVTRKEQKDKVLPAVICVWKDGNKSFSEHSEWIKKKCDDGNRVFVLDVTAMGLIESSEVSSYPTKYDQYATYYKLCCDMLYMGDSLTAMRTWDVLRAVDMVCSVYGNSRNDITVYCESKYGVYGELALFADNEIKAEYGEGLTESVEKEIIDVYAKPYEDDYSVILPGMLKYFDYGELKR